MYNCNTHWIVNKSKGFCLDAIEYTYILGVYHAIESVYTKLWIFTSSTMNIMLSNRNGLFVVKQSWKNFILLAAFVTGSPLFGWIDCELVSPCLNICYQGSIEINHNLAVLFVF